MKGSLQNRRCTEVRRTNYLAMIRTCYPPYTNFRLLYSSHTM